MSLNLEAVEAAVNMFHKVRESLRKQAEHNLYRIRESATSELIQRTLCNILAINLGNRIRVDEQLEDFRLKHFEGVSLTSDAAIQSIYNLSWTNSTCP